MASFYPSLVLVFWISLLMFSDARGPNILMELGKPLNVTCFDDLVGGKEIAWKKDGIAIAQNDHSTAFPSGLLLIKAGRVEDADEYECLNIDDRSEFINIVYYKELPAATSASVGDNLTLHCEAGKKTPIISWSKDGDSLPNATSKYVTNSNKSSLHIISVDSDDEGTYGCTICFDSCDVQYVTQTTVTVSAPSSSAAIVGIVVACIVVVLILVAAGITYKTCPQKMPCVNRANDHKVSVETEIKLQPDENAGNAVTESHRPLQS